MGQWVTFHFITWLSKPENNRTVTAFLALVVVVVTGFNGWSLIKAERVKGFSQVSNSERVRNRRWGGNKKKRPVSSSHTVTVHYTVPAPSLRSDDFPTCYFLFGHWIRAPTRNFWYKRCYSRESSLLFANCWWQWTSKLGMKKSCLSQWFLELLLGQAKIFPLVKMFHVTIK